MKSFKEIYELNSFGIIPNDDVVGLCLKSLCDRGYAKSLLVTFTCQGKEFYKRLENMFNEIMLNLENR